MEAKLQEIRDAMDQMLRGASALAASLGRPVDLSFGVNDAMVDVLIGHCSAAVFQTYHPPSALGVELRPESAAALYVIDSVSVRHDDQVTLRAQREPRPARPAEGHR